MTDTVNVPREMIDAVMKVAVGLDEYGSEVFPGPFVAAELVRVALAAAPKVKQDYAELKRLAEGASQGPWKACGTIYEHMNCEIRTGAKGEGQPIGQIWDGPNAFADGQFIAAASPQVVLGLIARASSPAPASDELLEALAPFARYYDLNDCHERRPDDALEVPISDLARADDLIDKRGALEKALAVICHLDPALQDMDEESFRSLSSAYAESNPAAPVVGEPVAWPEKHSGPRTVGNMIANLSALPLDMPIWSAYHISQEDNPSLLKVKVPTLSRERVDGTNIKTGDESVPYSAVIWSDPKDPVEALIGSKLDVAVKALEELRGIIDTLRIYEYEYEEVVDVIDQALVQIRGGA